MAITIKNDIQIEGLNGEKWSSNSSMAAAVSNRVMVFHPEDAPRFLRAHSDLMKSRHGIEPFQYKIFSIELAGRMVSAIGSAVPNFYFGGDEQALGIQLIRRKEVHYAYATSKSVDDPAFEQTLLERIYNFEAAKPLIRKPRGTKTKDLKPGEK